METIITLSISGLSLIFLFSLLLWRGEALSFLWGTPQDLSPEEENEFFRGRDRERWGEEHSLSSEEVNARLRRMSP